MIAVLLKVLRWIAMTYLVLATSVALMNGNVGGAILLCALTYWLAFGRQRAKTRRQLGADAAETRQTITRPSLDVKIETDIDEGGNMVNTRVPVAEPRREVQKITVHRKFTKLTPATSFIAFDFETTGLSPATDTIIEVGAVKYCDGEVADTFSCFVDPGRSIPAKITQITGITNRMVKGSRTIDEVMPAFLGFIGDLPLVAHNARFDADFLAINLPSGYKLKNHVYDNLAACRETFPYIQNHKLPTVISHLGIKVASSHRALDDAKATAQIFFHCLCQHSSSPAAR